MHAFYKVIDDNFPEFKSEETFIENVEALKM